MPDRSMIDDEKTFQRFKYRSADLGPKSGLHVACIQYLLEHVWSGA